MVMTDVELGPQLKEVGKQLSNPPATLDALLHVLDQTEKLLQKVDQSPSSLMQEALDQTIKALVDESLLEHSNVDVKVSVASCICEITRITAPDAPYTDEEMKGAFRCIVSSFENLSDETSRYYGKRASILDTVCKVRSCVIMLDLECDELIVRMFEHFLNSVRDHHLDKMFSLMMNIMALVIEESEDPSPDMLRPLMASIKNNCEGILPVARKLGEEVIKKSADKLRPFLNQLLNILGGSLDDYSQVLTSIIKGTTDVFEHNGESAAVQPKADETYRNIAFSADAAQVTSNGKMVTGNEGSDGKESKKPEEVVDHQPEEVVDHSGSNLTSKLDINNSVAELANVQSNEETTSPLKSTEPSDSSQLGENKTEKLTDILFSVKKGIRSKKKVLSQTDASSTDILTKAPVNTSDYEMRLPKRARKKAPKVEDDKPLAISGSDEELLKKSTKKVNIVNLGSKNKSLSQTDAPAPSTDIGLTKAPEFNSDTEVRSLKRARNKTPKAYDSKPSATCGSDVEHLKKSTNKVDKVDSGSKKKSSSQTDTPSADVGLIKSTEEVSDSGMRSPKRVRKKTPKAEYNKPSATSDLDDKLLKKSSKKVVKVDSESNPVKRSGKKVGVAESVEDKRSDTSSLDVEPMKMSNKKVETDDTGSKPVKWLGKKVGGAESVEDKDKSSATSGSDVKPLKKSSKKVETVVSESKPVKRSGKKVGGGDSVAKKCNLSGKKELEPNKPKHDDRKVGAGDSEVKSSKRSRKNDNGSDSDAKPLKKLSGKKRERTKTITMPSEATAHKNEDSDSDDKTETDSDNQPIRQSAKKGNKSSSSMVKSSSKNKVGKKGGRGENVKENDQAKFLSEDDGLDVSLKSALTTTKREGNLEIARATTSKRKRSVGKKKLTESIKYDDSLVGEKVKVWWPKDTTYYEGVIKSFDASKNRHKVLYLDGEVESLILKKEKWEIINEYSEAQSTDILPKTAAGVSNGESKIDNKSKNTKEVELRDDDMSKSVVKNKAEPQKIVYKSMGKKGNKSKTKTVEIEAKSNTAETIEAKSNAAETIVAKSNAAETIEAKSAEDVQESEGVGGEESEKKL